MQIGTENRKKTIAAVALFVLALVFVVYRLFPSSSPTPTASTTSGSAGPVASAAPARARVGGKKVAAGPRSLDPTLRYDWLKASEDTKYEGSGRNIFLATAEIPIPAPIKPGNTDKGPQLPPPPPPPPPINLKFFGFANRPGEPKKIFLSQGEDVFIAAEGDIVDRRYKVLHIAPMSVEIEDVLNNNRQSIPLTQG
jgi:hypothetical protein